MNSAVFHGLDIRERTTAGCCGLKQDFCGECHAAAGCVLRCPLRLRDAVVRQGPNMRTCETVHTLRDAGVGPAAGNKKQNHKYDKKRMKS